MQERRIATTYPTAVHSNLTNPEISSSQDPLSVPKPGYLVLYLVLEKRPKPLFTRPVKPKAIARKHASLSTGQAYLTDRRPSRLQQSLPCRDHRSLSRLQRETRTLERGKDHKHHRQELMRTLISAAIHNERHAMMQTASQEGPIEVQSAEHHG